MKAILCKKFGPPSSLVYEDIADPTPASDEVLLKVKACSVNFPDSLIIQGLYQFKPELPFSPGADIAGEIIAIGSEVSGFKVGDEVVGLSTHGGYAEKAVLKANACFPKPSGMSMTNAAAFLMAYGTSYYALKVRANLKPGDSLLVLGASGGVGLTAVELGKLMGAKVIAAASTQEKLDLCKSYGADELINYETEDLKARVKEITGRKGVNIVLDPVGDKYTDPALRSIAWEGHYLVVGFAAGTIPKVPLNLALLKSCQIVGVFWGAFAQKFPKQNLALIQELVMWFMQKKINPCIQKEYLLEEAPQALEAIMNRKAKGKMVVVIDS